MLRDGASGRFVRLHGLVARIQMFVTENCSWVHGGLSTIRQPMPLVEDRFKDLDLLLNLTDLIDKPLFMTEVCFWLSASTVRPSWRRGTI